MQTLRRVGVGSAFKVGAYLSGLVFAVFGFFIILLPSLFGAGLLGDLLGSRGAFGAGFLAGLIGYVVGIVLYALLGGIVAAIYAWLFNIAAGRAGGLEVDIS